MVFDEKLKRLGWSDTFEAQFESSRPQQPLYPVRVIGEHRHGIVVHDGSIEQFVPHIGRWLNHSRSERPVVGDWILVNQSDKNFDRILHRENVLQRMIRRNRSVQTMATNINIMVVVFSCNETFNESRLERYLALAEISNVKAHIVLTKKDLYSDFPNYVQNAQSLVHGWPVHAVNSLDRATLGEIVKSLKPSETAILAGPSGVGKSTIINSLAKANVQKTQEVRGSDAKGKHTTSARRLIRLPWGALVIDIPGTRELELVEGTAGLPQTFPDIEELASCCQFSNCSHGSEPGCKIREAIESETLASRRFENYTRIRRGPLF